MPRKKKDWADGLGKGLMIMAGMAAIHVAEFMFAEDVPQLVARPASETDKAIDFQSPRTWFHAGQLEAWASDAIVTLILAGTQSGKTAFMVWWLLREIQRKGPGDYILVGPRLKGLRNKALPMFKLVLVTQLKVATFNETTMKFDFTPEGLVAMFGTNDPDSLLMQYGWRDPNQPIYGEDGAHVDNVIVDPEFAAAVTIHCGFAENPDTLESYTVKGVVGDEVGQKVFKYASHLALQRRRVRYNARALYGTTPYNLDWVKTSLHDRCENAFKTESGRQVFLERGPKPPSGKWEYIVGAVYDEREYPSLLTVRFESWLNPTFGGTGDALAEFERIRQSGIAEWRFDMFYRGKFTKPNGLVYDTFDRTRDTFGGRVPPTFRRAIGMDFGAVNTCAVKVAANPEDGWKDGAGNPDPTLYVYGSYLDGRKSTEDHVTSILFREDTAPPPNAVGGAPSEKIWRADFYNNGLPIEQPVVAALDVQIQIVYGKLKRGKLKIHTGLTWLIDEMEKFSLELDEEDEPIPGKYEDERKYHRLAALRYVVSQIAHDPAFILGLPFEAVDMDPDEHMLASEEWVDDNV